jgi:hypothetical protein
MNSSNEMTLWAGRFSVTSGYGFVAERKVTEETAQDWLEVFRKDEPGVIFLVSKTKPKVKVQK